jgi:serralysin
MPSLIETADAPAIVSTPYTLLPGQTAQGMLTGGGDHDWYRVDLVAGQSYSFAMTGTGINNVNDTFLQLYASNGTTVVAADDDALPGLNSAFTYTAATTGAYYIDAAAFSSAGFFSLDNGQYGISFTTGTRASFDLDMAAGVIDTDLSWSATPGAGTVVTYGFRQSAAPYSEFGHNISTFSQLTATEIAAVRTILGLWSDVSGITFQEVNPGGYADNAAILFGNYFDPTDGSGAFAAYPGSTLNTNEAGDVWLNTASIETSTPLAVGSYSFFAIMHEIGHAVGLSHPGNYNAAPGLSITYANDAQFVQDSNQYTVMSYFDETDTGAQFNSYANTPMLADILALQDIYGVNAATRTGNTIYGFHSNAGSVYDFATNPYPAFCVWDAGGNDTIDASGFSQNQSIDLAAGSFSSIGSGTNNVSIAVGVTIENVFGGSGNDTINGNAANNKLNGGAGADTVDESYSATWDVGYAFSTGSTVYLNNSSEVDSLTSVERILFGSGVDTVYSDGTVAVDGGGNSNYLIMYGSGPFAVHLDTTAASHFNLLYLSGGADTADVAGSTYAYMFGLGGNDTMTLGVAGGWAYGGDGNDMLSGSGVGKDILLGEAGDDTIYAQAGDDVVYAGIGNDVVVGGDGNDIMWGEAGNDILTGGNGNDFLIGQDGNDYLTFDYGTDIGYGGVGADTFCWSSTIQGADIVGDFNHAEGDKLYLDHTAFGVSAGLTLVQGTNFFSGAGILPTQATATAYFDTTSGILWFDPNGTVAGGAQAITFLSNGGGGLAAGDILFV